MPIEQPPVQPSEAQYTVCTKLRISVTEGTQAYQPPTVELLFPDSGWGVIYAGGSDGDGWAIQGGDFEIYFKEDQLDTVAPDLKTWLNANQAGTQ